MVHDEKWEIRRVLDIGGGGGRWSLSGARVRMVGAQRTGLHSQDAVYFLWPSENAGKVLHLPRAVDLVLVVRAVASHSCLAINRILYIVCDFDTAAEALCCWRAPLDRGRLGDFARCE